MTDSESGGVPIRGSAAKKAPALIAYIVRKSGDKSFWERIGAAFVHKDGQGFDLSLEATPVDGRLTLRIPTEKPAGKEPKDEKAA